MPSVREFLQNQRDRWRQIAARFTRQIESLQAEVQALQATNVGLGTELSARPAEGDQAAAAAAAEDASRRYLMAMDDIRDLKTRNAELQRQLLEAQTAQPRRGPAASPAESGGDWESQKRRLLAELESDDHHDAESKQQRLKIEEVIARTDQIIAEKNREIEELQNLLNNQSNSLGSLAFGAAALGEVSTRTRSSSRSGSGSSSCRTSVRPNSARPRSSLPWNGLGLPAAKPRSKRRSAMPTSAIPRPRPRPWRRPAGRSAAAGGRSWA